jgi:hypothetical protein
MAEAWVKMRQTLAKDPRVIRMATTLRRSPEFQEWAVGQSCDISVTQSVTVCVTVASLLQVWSVARMQGKADGDDLVLKHSTLDTIDELAGVPGFGKVMESVEWAQVEAESLLRFPRCLPHMLSPDERARELAAERKRIQRDKERDKSRDTSRPCPTNVTPREQNNREEKIVKGPSPSTISARPNGDCASVMQWGKTRDDADLLNDSKIDELFGTVVACGFAHDTDEDRQRFAALVFNLRRQGSAKFGLLTRILEGRVKSKFAKSTDWKIRATEADHDRARRALKALDGLEEAS